MEKDHKQHIGLHMSLSPYAQPFEEKRTTSNQVTTIECAFNHMAMETITHDHGERHNKIVIVVQLDFGNHMQCN